MRGLKARSLGHARQGPCRWALASAFALSCLAVTPPAAVASFGIETFAVSARNADGTIDEQAASHPFLLDVHLAMNRDQSGEPEGSTHTIELDLPPGLVGNALAVPRCSHERFLSDTCAGSTQVGTLHGVIGGVLPGDLQVDRPIYNLAASTGHAASFGALVNGESIVQQINLASGEPGAPIRISTILPAEPTIVDLHEEIWGVPADPAHNSERTCKGADDQLAGGCVLGPEQPLLTLPASCGGPIRTTVVASSYDLPPLTAAATAYSLDAGGNPGPLVGCEGVPFDPRLTVATEGLALAPSALGIGIEVPQHESVDVTPTAPLAGVEIALPAGLALNPSAGSWLAGCAPGEIGLETAPGATRAAFAEGPAHCPPASRVGTVKLRTPLIDHQLEGSIYLATPGANPFGARYAIYLALEDEATGIAMKIPARLEADSVDGRLTAVVPALPSLPFSKLELEFSGGPQAPLVDPPSCGRYSTEATFTPTTAPFAPIATKSSSFTVSSSAFGAPCPPPEAQRNAAPSFRAGTEAPRAGGNSPLVIHFSREAGEQHFGSFDLTLPPGLVADLGSVPVGAAVGSVRVDAGLGSPLALDGTAYLGGPYEGAPYSLEIVVPAQVGPFDLGTIVERAALEVDPTTAQVTVRSDPLPQILAGVPLELRSLTLDLDRPGFVRNPTSCEPMAIMGSATTSLGQMAPLAARFQVGDCAKLQFRPKLGLRFSGALGRNGHPALRAVLSGNPQGAALASVGFSLPADELLDLRHLRGLCPRGVAPSSCPSDSRLGTLRLESPFLDGPVEGPVYIRVPSHRLPDFTAELRSGRLRFVLNGRATSSKGRFGVRFESLPDIPLSKAVLSLPGGRGGIVVNSRSLCSGPGTVTATTSAHNGMRRQLRVRPRLDGGC
jgi:hypothetical protein